MPQVLVTGSEGFLGGYICRALASAGWQVAGLDRAPAGGAPASAGRYFGLSLPSRAFDEVLETLQPQAICHAAGPASVADSLADPAADFRASVESLACVLDAVRRIIPGCRVLFLSSAAVYGNPLRLPVAEDDLHRPLSPYGYHKSLCERLIEEYATVYGVPGASLRLFSAYGPGLRRQVMWDVCRKVLESGEVELFGTGEETRDFVHARDVGRAVTLLLDKARFQAEAYNLAEGRETRIRDLALLIAAALGRSPRLRFTGRQRPGDPVRWQADVTRLRDLGYEASQGLSEGVADYARWAMRELSAIRPMQ